VQETLPKPSFTGIDASGLYPHQNLTLQRGRTFDFHNPQDIDSAVLIEADGFRHECSSKILAT
jgi:hypothetical protein